MEKTIDLHIFFTLMQGTELFKKASQLSLKRVKRAGFAWKREQKESILGEQ